MSSRRTLILIGAIAIGAFAAFALLNYVRGLEDSVYEDAQPVEVLIASENIPAGTPASEALTMVEIKQIPLDIRPADIVDPNLTDSITGLIALNEIPANQIIIPGLFVDATVVQQSFKDQIPSGLVAISLNVEDVRAVGGNLQPGDEVNIMVLHENQVCGSEEDEEAEDAESDSEGQSVSEPVIAAGELPVEELYCTYAQPARYLFQRVEILKIGSRELLQPGQTNEAAAETSGGGTITFMVPSDAAQIIASVAPSDIYLTLLPEDYEAEQLPALTVEFIEGPSPAEDPEWLTPYGPDGFVDGEAGLAVSDDAAPAGTSDDGGEG